MVKINNALDKISSVMSKVVGAISGVSIVVLCLMLTVDVILRKVASSGIFGSYELTQLLLAMIIFACFGMTQFSRSHIHVYVLIRAFPRKLRFFVSFLGEAICCVMSFMLSRAILKEAIRQAPLPGCVTELLGIPTAPVFFVCGFAAAVLTFGFFAEVLRNVMAIFNEEVAADVEKDWV